MRCSLLFPAPRIRATLVLLLCAANAGTAWSGELLVFPSVTGVMRTGGDANRKKQEIQPALDFFYTLEHGRILVLAEFLVTDEERELERLQVGFAATPFHKIWLGRYHNPLSYWDSAYHHGAYMQPSITRPGIAKFEDEQGVLPMHTTGILLEGSTALSKARLHYDLALGVGPLLGDALHPADILAPTSERGRLGIGAKLGLRPADNETDETGVFAGYTEIPITGRPYTDTKQTVAGAYFNREWEQWRFTGELTAMRNRLESPQAVSRADFTNVYVHGEYKASGEWTGYGRLEASANAQNPYLDMFPGFIAGRVLIGSRWEPLRNQAVKFELWRGERQDGLWFNGLAAQWSAVFP